MVFAIRSYIYDSFVTGDKSVPLQRIKLVTEDKYMARIQHCTATRVMLNQPCTWTAKIHAILSSHRDNFSAKVP